MNTSCLMVYMTYPSNKEARRIGRLLVEEKLAACVNILGPCTSIYRWNEAVEEGQEVVAIAKTTSAAYPDLKKRVIQEHPYDVPCITAYKIEEGNADYLSWLSKETQ